LAAFKRSNEGAFFNAYDNINESFKAIEDAIAAVGVNTDQRKYLKIGINTELFHTENSKINSKYQTQM